MCPGARRARDPRPHRPRAPRGRRLFRVARLRRRPAAALLGLVILLAACGDEVSTGVEGAPTELLALSPALDSVPTGERIDPPVSVRVQNASGAPVEGIPVRFSLVSGQGELFPSLAVSDGDGVAEAAFEAGTTPGEVKIRVDIPSATNVRALEFTILIEPAATVTLAVSGGDAQRAEVGSQLALPFEVRATSASGAAAGGITLAWRVGPGRPGARLTADTTTTDGDGLSRVLLTLGGGAGTYQVDVFATAGVASDTARFTAEATATFVGDVRLDSVAPLPLVSGEQAVLFGEGFAATAAGNEVRIEGAVAEILEAGPTSLRVSVPAFGERCLPARDVGVRALVGDEASNGAIVRLRPALPPLELALGEVRTLRGPEAVACVQFESSESREYQLAVQSASGAGSAATSMRLVTRGGAEEPRRGSARIDAAQTLDPAVARTAQAYQTPEHSIRTSARQELLRRRARPARRATGDSTVRAAVQAQPAAVGDTVSYRFAVGSDFSATCSDTTNRVQGVVRELRSHVLLVEDTEAPAPGFTAEEWAQLADQLNATVFPTDTAYFGSPADIDANERVIFLFTPEVNRLNQPGSPTAIGGFFLPLDLAASGRGGGGASGPGGETCPASNEAELVYLVVADPEAEFGDAVSKPRALRNAIGLSAHELQHLINAGRRVILGGAGFADLEEAWIDEGLSHLAEEVAGLGQVGLATRANLTYEQVTGSRADLNTFNAFHINNFFQLSLFMFNPNGAPALAADDPGGITGLQMRGFGWFFLRWLGDQEGGDERGLFRLLSGGGRNQLRGVDNVEAATVQRWEDLLADFAASLPADDTQLEELGTRYQVLSWNFRDVFRRLNENPAASSRFFAPFPLAVTALRFETAAVDFDVQASTAKYFNLRSGETLSSLALSLLRPGGNVLAASAAPQITIVRTR